MLKRMRWIAVLVAVALAAVATATPATAAKSKTTTTLKPRFGLDHGVGRGVAHRSVHEDGHRLPEAQQGHDDHVQLRGFVQRSPPRSRVARRPTCSRPPTARTCRSSSSGGQVTAYPTIFAANVLIIVVKPGNPKNVKSLADLAESRHDLALRTDGAVRQVRRTDPYPGGCDHPARQVTRGADVKTTLAAVATGDADAAIVYVSDAKSAGRAWHR